MFYALTKVRLYVLRVFLEIILYIHIRGFCVSVYSMCTSCISFRSSEYYKSILKAVTYTLY